MTAFIAFTLYGIEAIGAQLEDPFGYDRNDIKVDAIVEDLRVETTVLIENWRRGGDMFPMMREMFGRNENPFVPGGGQSMGGANGAGGVDERSPKGR